MENRLSLGIIIESVTVDGLLNLMRAVRKSSPETIIIKMFSAHSEGDFDMTYQTPLK